MFVCTEYSLCNPHTRTSVTDHQRCRQLRATASATCVRWDIATAVHITNGSQLQQHCSRLLVARRNVAADAGRPGMAMPRLFRAPTERPRSDIKLVLSLACSEYIATRFNSTVVECAIRVPCKYANDGTHLSADLPTTQVHEMHTS